MKPRSDNLSILYEWREGSLPPPYHYEYSITINSSGDSEMAMIPDYASHGAPTWTEQFHLAKDELGSLAQALKHLGLFAHEWRAQEHPPVGGSSESLDVTANEKAIHIPSYLVGNQAQAASRIFAKVKARVPKVIWDKLAAQREQYVQEHEKGN